jgi:hypothetical protein
LHAPRVTYSRWDSATAECIVLPRSTGVCAAVGCRLSCVGDGLLWVLCLRGGIEGLLLLGRCGVGRARGLQHADLRRLNGPSPQEPEVLNDLSISKKSGEI